MKLSNEKRTKVYKTFIDYIVKRLVQHESCSVCQGKTKIEDVDKRSQVMDSIGIYDFAIVYQPSHMWINDEKIERYEDGRPSYRYDNLRIVVGADVGGADHENNKGSFLVEDDDRAYAFVHVVWVGGDDPRQSDFDRNVPLSPSETRKMRNPDDRCIGMSFELCCHVKNLEVVETTMNVWRRDDASEVVPAPTDHTGIDRIGVNVYNFFYGRRPLATFFNHADCFKQFSGTNTFVQMAKPKDIGMSLVFVVADVMLADHLSLADWHINRMKEQPFDCSFYRANFEFFETDADGDCRLDLHYGRHSKTRIVFDQIARLVKGGVIGRERGTLKQFDFEKYGGRYARHLDEQRRDREREPERERERERQRRLERIRNKRKRELEGPLGHAPYVKSEDESSSDDDSGQSPSRLRVAGMEVAVAGAHVNHAGGNVCF